MLQLRYDRKRLGFLEHYGSISLARYPDRSPCVDWHRAVDLWSEGSGYLRRLETGMANLWSSLFVCDGRLPLHVDMVGKGVTTMGMIIANESSLKIASKEQVVQADSGDIFRKC